MYKLTLLLNYSKWSPEPTQKNGATPKSQTSRKFKDLRIMATKIYFTDDKYASGVVKVFITDDKYASGVVKVFPVTDKYASGVIMAYITTDKYASGVMKVFICSSQYD